MQIAEKLDVEIPEVACNAAPTVIVGAGPVGQRLIAELRKRDADREIVMIGDEPWAPYDRVQLSSWLAGAAELPTDRELNNDASLHLQLGTRIKSIDRTHHALVDDSGKTWTYGKLVLATGSSAFIPPIPGTDLDGVYTFRNLADAQQLMARTVRSRSMVVIGGGLLGLETARALRRFNTRVTIVEQSARLMFHQLDSDTAAVLEQHVESLGIDVITSSRVVAIDGVGKVTSIRLNGDRTIECDTVVIAAGITPNIGLARDCGLHTRRGILVDDTLTSSDTDILAVGECAEHRNKVYGLVSPGFEQAAVAAHILAGEAAEYAGSQTAASLKILDCPVASAGAVETEWSRRSLTWRNRRSGKIRRIMLDGNRLDTAMAVGEWDEFSRVREAVRTRRRIRPWRALRFYLTGNLWGSADSNNVADWPAAATICNCKGVTRGDLTTAVSGGCSTVDSLAGCTGASTVCGSCKPLLVQLLGVANLQPVRAAYWLTAAGVLAAIAALFWYLPLNLAYADTVSGFSIDILWRESLLKQITGFSLLGMSVLLGLVSLRKRFRKLSWGSFDGWRLVHVLVGVVTLLVLVAHTGLRMGDNINFYLMFVFSGLVLAGAVAGIGTGLQHALPLTVARRIRSMSVWAHILLLWPLPALLGFHILKTYWY